MAQIATRITIGKLVCGLVALSILASCGASNREERIAANRALLDESLAERRGLAPGEGRESIFDLFDNRDDPNVTVEVNRYLWSATLEVLDFLPIEAADPFSGVIAFGYGTPPGGRRAYSGTVLIQDPALDARSLTVSLRTRSGPLNVETQRQIEDAILTRARQLRIQDSNL